MAMASRPATYSSNRNLTTSSRMEEGGVGGEEAGEEVWEAGAGGGAGAAATKGK